MTQFIAIRGRISFVVRYWKELHLQVVTKYTDRSTDVVLLSRHPNKQEKSCHSVRLKFFFEPRSFHIDLWRLIRLEYSSIPSLPLHFGISPLFIIFLDQFFVCQNLIFQTKQTHALLLIQSQKFAPLLSMDVIAPCFYTIDQKTGENHFFVAL